MDAGKKKAVILDLVANARSIEDLAYIKNLQKLYQQKISLGRQVGYVGGVHEIKDFDIIDYTEDIIKLLKSLRKRTCEECLINLLNFIKKEERLPHKKEINLYNTLKKLYNNKYGKNYFNFVKEIKDLCDKLEIDSYTKRLTSQECLINLLNFIKKEKRLPYKKEKIIYSNLLKLRNGKYNKEYPNFIQEIENLCNNKLGIDLYTKIQSPKECLINLLNFIKKEKRLPNKKEINLYSTLKKLRSGKYNKDYPNFIQEIENLCDKLEIDLYTKILTSQGCLINLLNFIKREERLPLVKELSFYAILIKLRNGKYNKDYPELVKEIKDLCNELGINLYTKKLTSQECLINLLNFIKKEERLPYRREINLYSTLRKLRNGKYDEEYSELVQEIKDLCNKLNLSLNTKED